MKEDILDEISTDLKHENLVKLAQKYGKYLAYLALAVIAAVALYTYTHTRSISKQENVSTEYFKLFESTQPFSQTKHHAELEAFIKKYKGTIYADLAVLKLKDLKPELYAQTLLELINTSKYIEIINPAKIKLATIALQNNLSNYKRQSIALLEEGIKEPGFMVNTLRITLAELLLDAGEKDKARAVLANIISSNTTPAEAKFIANVLGGQ